MHAHMLTHNVERIADSLSRTNLWSRTSCGCWSVEEEETLINLDMMFPHTQNINQLIAAEMVSKTPKQISDKRRFLTLCPEQTTSGGEAESASTVEVESVTLETETQSPVEPPKKIKKILAQRACQWLKRGQSLSEKVREVLDTWVEGQPGIPAWVDSVSLDVLTSFLGVLPGPQRAPSKKGPKESGKPISWMNKCAIKQGTFLQYLHLFGTDRKLLAAIILCQSVISAPSHSRRSFRPTE